MNDLSIVGEEPINGASGSSWADSAGMMASIGCAIHCAAMPLVLAYLPALGLSWLADEGFHKAMAGICFALAALAFVPGWRKHGSIVPAIWGATGVLLLTTAAFSLECACCQPSSQVSSIASESEVKVCTDPRCTLCERTPTVASQLSSLLDQLVPLVTPLGGIFLVVGHIVNHRKTCVCQGDSCCLTTDERERDE